MTSLFYLGYFKDYFTYSRKVNAYGQIYNKGMSKLISISKDERFFLESQGYKMHEHIFPTYTRRYKHYFAIETHDVLKCLKNYRRKCVIHK